MPVTFRSCQTRDSCCHDARIPRTHLVLAPGKRRLSAPDTADRNRDARGQRSSVGHRAGWPTSRVGFMRRSRRARSGSRSCLPANPRATPVQWFDSAAWFRCRTSGGSSGRLYHGQLRRRRQRWITSSSSAAPPGCRPQQSALVSSDPDGMSRILRRIGIDVPVEPGEHDQLRVRIVGPTGELEIRS